MKGPPHFLVKQKEMMMKWATIYVLILLILIYFHNDYGFDDFIYGDVVGNFLMYTIAIGAAEFQLLAYCRFKFPLFNKTWENKNKVSKISKEK